MQCYLVIQRMLVLYLLKDLNASLKYNLFTIMTFWQLRLTRQAEADTFLHDPIPITVDWFKDGHLPKSGQAELFLQDKKMPVSHH